MDEEQAEGHFEDWNERTRGGTMKPTKGTLKFIAPELNDIQIKQLKTLMLELLDDVEKDWDTPKNPKLRERIEQL